MWVQRAALLAVGVVVLSAVHCSATGTVCGIPKCTVPGAKVRPHADTCGAGQRGRELLVCMPTRVGRGQREGLNYWSACRHVWGGSERGGGLLVCMPEISIGL